MRSFWANSANPYPTRIHPALTSFADECCGTLARLLVYVGTLALLAIVGLHLWDQLPLDEATEPAARPGWSAASRSYSAFAVSQFDLPGKAETYEILRHPLGGRKDVLHWAAQGEKPVAELEIYRPGGELGRSGPVTADIADRMDPNGGRELESAGVIDSKFGAVTLLRDAGSTDGARSCLGFIKRLGEPHLQLSGWSCQGDTLPARRAAIGCMLSRLILLTAGRPETGRIIRPRRAQTRQLRPIGHNRPFGGLGHRRGKPAFARHAVIKPAHQDAGFHATFSFRPALSQAVWPD